MKVIFLLYLMKGFRRYNNHTKNFGRKQALKGLNMTVPMGAIYGFIGENGSGKSTTEKLICGLLVPSGGSIKLYGKDA